MIAWIKKHVSPWNFGLKFTFGWPDPTVKPVKALTMNITPEQREKIEAVVGYFETDSKTGYGKVTSVSGDKGQLTYGKHQTTMPTGNLYLLIRAYLDEPMAQHKELENWLRDLKNANPKLNTDKALHEVLRKAGDDPVMQKVQDEFFDQKYWQPALRWANKNGFETPLALVVIYDSFIQSGQILPFLRRRFPALPPAAGGKEKEWITQYVETRHHWLSTYSASKNKKTNQLLRNSSYRTEELQNLIRSNNWQLESPFKVRGHKL